MCGIVGYVGPRIATPMLIEGLKRMEYRGYDSAGVALLGDDGVAMRRAKGKIAELETTVAARPIQGTVGIGHTRWATHGAPSEKNAHPQRTAATPSPWCTTGSSRTTSVLRKRLMETGHVFSSDTDTEVLAHLIEEALRRQPRRGGDGRARQGGRDVRHRGDVEPRPGQDRRRRARAARCSSAWATGENFVASDVSAILAHTRQVVYLDDGDMAVLDARRVPRDRPRCQRRSRRA